MATLWIRIHRNSLSAHNVPSMNMHMIQSSGGGGNDIVLEMHYLEPTFII